MELRALSQVRPDDYPFGNKALGLAWLLTNGFQSPEGICISISKAELNSSNLAAIKKFFFRIIQAVPDGTRFVVRSSTSAEDTLTQSQAGKYLTITNLTFAEVPQAVESFLDHTFLNHRDLQETGFIIQPQIEAKYSGILFTSDPVSGLKRRAVLSIGLGAGSLLVSGEGIGNNYVLSHNKIKLVSGELEIPATIVASFSALAKRIRKTYPFPSDIEFIVNESDEIWLVQIRPITGIGPETNEMYPVGGQLESGENKEKINLRYYARQFALKISKGWKLKISTRSEARDVQNLISDFNSEALLSLVLIMPTLLNEKVYRRFCKKESLATHIEEVISWTSTNHLFIECILKEILTPEFTGMIKKQDAGFVVEISRGHYLPKGISSLNTYVLDEQHNLKDKNEVVQLEYFELTEQGQKRIPKISKYSFTHKELDRIVTTFEPFLNHVPCVLEFGVMPNHEIILLDYSEERTHAMHDPIQTGIISIGQIIGILVNSKDYEKVHRSFDAHHKDQIKTENKGSADKIIVWSDRPLLALSAWIEKCGRNNIGFVFSELSLLSHLSITLRELGIPAIWWDGDISSCIGKKVKIDAQSSGLNKKDRLICL